MRVRLVSRRSLLRSGSVAAVSLTVPSRWLAWLTGAPGHARAASSVSLSQTLNDSLASLTEMMFAGAVQTSFAVTRPGSTNVSLKLLSVTDHTPASARTLGQECFSLRFKGPSTSPLRQDMYRVKHRVLGAFALLLVPVGPAGRVVYYEAIINRVVPA